MKTYASKDLIVEKQDIGYEVMDVDTEQRRVKAVWARRALSRWFWLCKRWLIFGDRDYETESVPALVERFK